MARRCRFLNFALVDPDAGMLQHWGDDRSALACGPQPSTGCWNLKARTEPGAHGSLEPWVSAQAPTPWRPGLPPRAGAVRRSGRGPRPEPEGERRERVPLVLLRGSVKFTFGFWPDPLLKLCLLAVVIQVPEVDLRPGIQTEAAQARVTGRCLGGRRACSPGGAALFSALHASQPGSLKTLAFCSAHACYPGRCAALSGRTGSSWRRASPRRPPLGCVPDTPRDADLCGPTKQAW